MRFRLATTVTAILCAALPLQRGAAQPTVPTPAAVHTAPAQSPVRPSSPVFSLGVVDGRVSAPPATIPFALGDASSCQEQHGRTYRVTLKIYNVLAQVVAIPMLRGRDEKVDNVELPCGQHAASWDGTVQGHPLNSGVYFYMLEVDGKATAKKIVVTGASSASK